MYGTVQIEQANLHSNICLFKQTFRTEAHSLLLNMWYLTWIQNRIDYLNVDYETVQWPPYFPNKNVGLFIRPGYQDIHCQKLYTSFALIINITDKPTNEIYRRLQFIVVTVYSRTYQKMLAYMTQCLTPKKIPWPLVCKRTIPTERPPLDEI
jgi:hypothetical protein